MNMDGYVIKHMNGKLEGIYYRVVKETDSTYDVERLEKLGESESFRCTGEINQFNGLIKDNKSLTKSRIIIITKIV